MLPRLQKQGLQVLVERGVHHTEFQEFDIFEPEQHGAPLEPRARTPLGSAALCSPARAAVDLGVTLGGDGTVLHLASLFTEDVPLPPVVSFAMGTLGFLTPFDVDDFISILNRVLDANSNHVYCTLRTRKRCEVLTYVRRLAGCCSWLCCLPGHGLHAGHALHVSCCCIMPVLHSASAGPAGALCRRCCLGMHPSTPSVAPMAV